MTQKLFCAICIQHHVKEPARSFTGKASIISIFWHLRLGLQVLIEDYVPDHGMKFGLILLLNFFAIGGAALGIFAVAKVAFTGVAA